MGSSDRRIYLDHNASSPLRERPLAALVEVLEEGLGNPGSGHAWGLRARERVESARRRVARSLAVRPSEIVFTSGGTESNNLAIRGVLGAGGAPPGRPPQLLVGATEHPSVTNTAKALVTAGAARVRTIGVDGGGRLDLEALEEHLSSDTALVAVMLANNETGVIHELSEVLARCRPLGVPVHCDVVQAVGKIPVDLGVLGVDSAALTAHKLGGPLGIGALYVRKGHALQPLLRGGGQERGLRPGTEPFALAHSMAVAVEDAVGSVEVMSSRVAVLRDHLEGTLLGAVDGSFVHGAAVARLPNTSLITFPGRDGPALMQALAERGVGVGTGSACHTHERKPSAVLTAMGVSAAEAHATLRLSLATTTTESEVEAALQTLLEVL